MLDVGYIANDRTSVSEIVSQVRSSMSASYVSDKPSAMDSVRDIDMVIPRIRVDTEVDRAILEYRSIKTGEVKRQFPTEEQLRAFSAAQSLIKVKEVEASTEKSANATENVTYDVPAVSGKASSSDVEISFETKPSGSGNSSYTASGSVANVTPTNTTVSSLMV